MVVYEDHATRYQTATEYVTIWREILTRSHTGESFTFHGERLSVDDAKLTISTCATALSSTYGLVAHQMMPLNWPLIRSILI